MVPIIFYNLVQHVVAGARYEVRSRKGKALENWINGANAEQRKNHRAPDAYITYEGMLRCAFLTEKGEHRHWSHAGTWWLGRRGPRGGAGLHPCC